MTRVEKLKIAHVEEVMKDPALAAFKNQINETVLSNIEESPYSYTILEGDKPLACLGVNEYWPGRGECWAFMPFYTGKKMLPIHRTVARFLSICPVRRLEIAVESNFKPGIRWAYMLGFELEAKRLKKYFINGSDAMLFARVK